MKKSITISIDAMGGENAPQKIIEGAHLALSYYPVINFLFFGDENKINPLLDKYESLKKVSTVFHTQDVVCDTDKPAHALRAGRTSSMRLAINAVKDGKANAVISSGNTGAYMAMAKFVLKTFPGIHRPAIATLVPSTSSEFVAMDLGANVVCDAENLEQFSILGSAYAKSVLGISNPRVCILNIGEEEQKGLPILHEAAERLKAHSTINFNGFIEADALFQGKVDVVVTDGFTGNVFLKTVEGTAKLLKRFLSEAFSSSLLSKIGYFFSRPALKYLSKRINPSNYNGAMFLGLNGIAIKSHGKADAIGFASAISVAIDMMQYDFRDLVLKMIDKSKENTSAGEQKK